MNSSRRNALVDESITFISELLQEMALTLADEVVDAIVNRALANTSSFHVPIPRRTRFVPMYGTYKTVNKTCELLGEDCSICMEQYKLREHVATLECTHVFHKRCMDKWVYTNQNVPSCPLCRALL